MTHSDNPRSNPRRFDPELERDLRQAFRPATPPSPPPPPPPPPAPPPPRQPGVDTTHSPKSGQDNSEEHGIDATALDLPKLTDLGFCALYTVNEFIPMFFVHRGKLVDVVESHEGDAFIRRLDVDSLRYHLARSARWYARRHGVEVEVAPPVEVVKDMLTEPDPPLPTLDRLVRTPGFAADGTLHTEHGYCADTRTFYTHDIGLHAHHVPRSPSDTDVAAAKDWLHGNLLVDFPFVDQADLANATALLLLPFARQLIRGPTPLHLIEKPTPGSGGTLLANMLLLPALGHDVVPVTEALDDAGWREQLASVLSASPPAVHIDGVSRPLDSAQLAAAITATSWPTCLSGRSELTTQPVRCAWVANGNAPRLSPEIARRSVRIRLGTGVNRQNSRSAFRCRLPSWARQHRPELVWSALTLIQAWLAAGRPAGQEQVPSLGMFESWSGALSSILAHAGIQGFLGNVE